jgi:alkaline phosphatase D
VSDARFGAARRPPSKTSDTHWFDLFERRASRRDFLRVGASAAGLVALGGLPGCGFGRSVRFAADPFSLGVASGDPGPDGVVLWARIGREALDSAGVQSEPVAVSWEISEDDAFSRIVRTGTADALPELGHSVHAEVGGLRPGRDYFYRFFAGDDVSPVGRTRTAPPLDAANDRFDFAFVSCQHYEQGYYTALRHLSEESLDLIVHLGDYIYEMAAIEGRPRRHEGPDIFTLDQYRARYTTYRSDEDLQAAHHSAPWIVSTDDHEVDNDYANDIAEDDQSPEDFLLRRAAAYQAFYEFLPVRRSSMPVGPDMQMYRRLRFGSLMEMNVLDTRQYRDDQPCVPKFGPSCPDHVDPARTILGAAQREWLFDGFSDSTARWNVLAQQVLVARFRNVNAEGDETWSMDKWDGYPAERQRLIDALGDSGVSNPIVLTGDIHSNWVARLLRDFEDERSDVVATEFVGTSISSGGNGRPNSRIGANALPHNPHFDFYNSQRGYVLASLTPGHWRSTYRIVPEVETPGGAVETLAEFVVENGHPGAQIV